MLRSLVALQGGFYVVTGLWPLLHRRSFEAVTGPKREGWLLETTGLLIASIGATLLVLRRRGDLGSAAFLGTVSAASLAAIDVGYVARRRIAPAYLADAAVELGLAALLLGTARRRPARVRVG